jgi:glucosamine--fructose-6-phosphate aminotransferase (isomerizing)
MCGIVGYVGADSALPILLDGLRRLEYRGYDSAGVALQVADGGVRLEKRAGRVAALAEALASPDRHLEAARTGIGHTRWATHGRPSDRNAHPHGDERLEVAVVHNGIIENHAQLRAALAARGHHLLSDTDSEVVAHLIEEQMRPDGDLVRAVQRAVGDLRGSFALVVLSRHAPDLLVGVRHQTPLVVARGGDGAFLASDISAILPHTREVTVLEDGEIAAVTPDAIRLFDFAGAALPARPPRRIAWDAAAAERGGYAHFMLKEIHEQPDALAASLRGRIGAEAPRLELDAAATRALREARRALLLGCGTAYHAGLVGRALLETWARVPSEADLGSEFRYREPIIDPQTLAIAVSQSGETADTLAALQQARTQGAFGLAVANVVDSSIARAADGALYTCAGPEIAVASTKAYTTQIAVLSLVALQAAALRGALPAPELAAWTEQVGNLPQWAEEVLATEPQVRQIAEWLAGRQHCFFIGRGLDWAVAMEGQLKLKEVSYLHAEAYAAGELKHGTLALVTDGTPVMALFTQPHLAEKMASNVAEVRARGGHVIGLAVPELAALAAPLCEQVVALPAVPAPLAPAVAAIPLQLLAYHTAVARGTDVDKPRNLAKSVTVE